MTENDRRDPQAIIEEQAKEIVRLRQSLRKMADLLRAAAAVCDERATGRAR